MLFKHIIQSLEDGSLIPLVQHQIEQSTRWRSGGVHDAPAEVTSVDLIFIHDAIFLQMNGIERLNVPAVRVDYKLTRTGKYTGTINTIRYGTIVVLTSEAGEVRFIPFYYSTKIESMAIKPMTTGELIAIMEAEE